MDPRAPGTAKLTGTEFWRLRVGVLRVIYLIDDPARLLIVLRVARRSESTYRRVDAR
jgi:mRNA-degrading endonuclease RelE of RelBE toxin-antitoxin system